MIEIVYDRDKHNVSAAGHAGSAEMGKDLICSAVSILFWTLGNNCYNLADEFKNREGLVVELKPGSSLISLPKSSSESDDDIIRYTFDTLCCGFEFLAHEFPEYVSYTVKGGGIENETENEI